MYLTVHVSLWVAVTIQMQSLPLKTVAKCRLYDLQEFFSVLISVSQKHMPSSAP